MELRNVVAVSREGVEIKDIKSWLAKKLFYQFKKEKYL